MPAHITLLYPFVDEADLTARDIERAGEVIGSFAAFDFDLVSVERFDNEPPERSFVWLAPVPAEPFVAMVRALHDAFPDHPPFGGSHDDVVPHLTVAASSDPATLDAAEAELQGCLPIRARARRALLMTHVAGGWRARARLPLEGG